MYTSGTTGPATSSEGYALGTAYLLGLIEGIRLVVIADQPTGYVWHGSDVRPSGATDERRYVGGAAGEERTVG